MLRSVAVAPGAGSGCATRHSGEGMRRGRFQFALLGVAVSSIALGAGVTLGYRHAWDPAAAIPREATAMVGRTGHGVGSAEPPAGAPAAAGQAAGPGGSAPVGRPSPPARASTASWPLVGVDSPGPPVRFFARVPVLMYHRVARPDQID